MATDAQHHEAGRILSPPPAPHPGSKSVVSLPLALTGQAPHQTIKRPSMAPRSSTCCLVCKLPTANLRPKDSRHKLQPTGDSKKWSRQEQTAQCEPRGQKAWNLPPVSGLSARQHSPPGTQVPFLAPWGVLVLRRPPHSGPDGPTSRHRARLHQAATAGLQLSVSRGPTCTRLLPTSRCLQRSAHGSATSWGAAAASRPRQPALVPLLIAG
ncbi:hypothetical protein NDU88_009619 [Pleurodeles waltl]|uniref:Uncharacterized protein n=1 Tax=Pleurodeles waltl TaxID=8319 RepID=A0AAV7PSZ8_PLEWA|nr:hypothetical protein NDU88_009619 [Pleurodeles waltl]